MNNFFKDIRSVGFDLDNTLYPPSEEIDDRIRIRFAGRALERMPELGSIEKALEFSENEYARIGSRTQVLRNLGFESPRDVAEECMTTADFVDLLKYDREVVSLLERIKSEYETFLITGAGRDLALPRMEKLGIGVGLFDYICFGDNPEMNVKHDGSIYRHFLNQSRYTSDQHVYVGDSLKADIFPTKALGMKTIGVGEIEGADFSVGRIHDVEKLLL